MPVDFTMDQSLAWEDIPLNELRLSLIGNKDLKYALVCNPIFVPKLVVGFSKCADIFMRDPSSETAISALSDHLAVTKILCAFLSRLTKGPESSAFLSALEPATRPLVFLLSNCSTNDKELSNGMMVQEIACDCLDLVLIMSNSRTYEFDNRGLVSYIFSAVSTRLDTSVQIRLLRLIPYVLSQEKCTSDEWVPLFSTLLGSAHAMATALIASQWAPLDESSDALNHMAFTSDRLPSLSLQLHPRDLSVDVPLLHEFVKRLAQIVVYADEHHLALFISGENGVESPTIIPVHLYFVLLMFLKDEEDVDVRVASLNLIIAYLTHLELTDNNVSVKKEYQKLFPLIVSLLDLDTDHPKNVALPMFLKSPTRILAELCSRLLDLAYSIEALNLDYKLMRRLENSATKCKLLRAVSVLKTKSEKSSQLMDFKILLSFARDDEPLADLLHLLSVCSAESESMRARIISFDNGAEPERPSSKPTVLGDLLFEILENYHFLQTQFVLAHNALTHESGPLVPRSDWSWLQSNSRIVSSLLNDSLATGAFSLLRSLLRLVALLRTFFVRYDALVSYYATDSKADSCGIIATLLRVVSEFGPAAEAATYFRAVFTSPATFDNQAGAIENLILAISITANLILDFSSFRNQVVEDPRFLPAVFRLYRDGLPGAVLTGSQLMNHETIQWCVLQVVSNYMFNETPLAKRAFLARFPLADTIAKTFYGMDREAFEQDEAQIREIRIKQKLVAFLIIRNLTAGLPETHEDILATYDAFRQLHPSLPRAWHQYLVASVKTFYIFSEHHGSLGSDEHMIAMMLEETYAQFVESIIYIENHRYSIPSRIPPLLFPATELLELWLRILGVQPNQSQLAKYTGDEVVKIITNLNAVKLGIVWILINLTWQGSPRTSSVPEHVSEAIPTDLRGGGGVPEVEMLDADENAGREVDSDESPSKQESPQTDRDTSEDGHNTGVSCIRHRIDKLNQMGFGHVVNTLIESFDGLIAAADTDSSEPSPSEQMPAHRFDIPNSHDLFEMLGNALRQLQERVPALHEDIARPSGGNEIDEEASEIPLERAANILREGLMGLLSGLTNRFTGATQDEALGGDPRDDGDDGDIGNAGDDDDDDDDVIEDDDGAEDPGMYDRSHFEWMARGRLMSSYGDGVYDAATIAAFEEAERETEEYYLRHPEEREE